MKNLGNGLTIKATNTWIVNKDIQFPPLHESKNLSSPKPKKPPGYLSCEKEKKILNWD